MQLDHLASDDAGHDVQSNLPLQRSKSKSPGFFRKTATQLFESIGNNKFYQETFLPKYHEFTNSIVEKGEKLIYKTDLEIRYSFEEIEANNKVFAEIDEQEWSDSRKDWYKQTLFHATEELRDKRNALLDFKFEIQSLYAQAGIDLEESVFNSNRTVVDLNIALRTKLRLAKIRHKIKTLVWKVDRALSKIPKTTRDAAYKLCDKINSKITAFLTYVSDSLDRLYQGSKNFLSEQLAILSDSALVQWVIDVKTSFQNFLSKNPLEQIEHFRATIVELVDYDRVDEYVAELPELLYPDIQVHEFLDAAIGNKPSGFSEFLHRHKNVEAFNKHEFYEPYGPKPNIKQEQIVVDGNDSGESSHSDSNDQPLVHAEDILQDEYAEQLAESSSSSAENDFLLKTHKIAPSFDLNCTVIEPTPTEPWQSTIRNMIMGDFQDYLIFAYLLPNEFEPIVFKGMSHRDQALPQFYHDVRGDHYRAGHPTRVASHLEIMKTETLWMRRKKPIAFYLNLPRAALHFLMTGKFDFSLLTDHRVERNEYVFCPDIAAQVRSAKTTSLTANLDTARTNLTIATRNITSVNFPYAYAFTDKNDVISNTVFYAMQTRANHLWNLKFNPVAFLPKVHCM